MEKNVYMTWWQDANSTLYFLLGLIVIQHKKTSVKIAAKLGSSYVIPNKYRNLITELNLCWFLFTLGLSYGNKWASSFWAYIFSIFYYPDKHCVKNVRILSFSGPYSVRMRENTDQENSEYGHFSRSEESRFLRKITH